MQKLISIPLLILYLAVSIGIQGVNHFCEGDLVSMVLYGDKKEADCGEMSCCEMPTEDDDCCTDVQFVVFYESERSLALTSISFGLNLPVHKALSFSSLLMNDVVNSTPPTTPQTATQIPTSVPIYLRNQSLIFYG